LAIGDCQLEHRMVILSLQPVVRYADGMNERQRFGAAAELYAQQYLLKRLWVLVGVNQRVGRGELDIIARQGDVLAFIEVKARRSRAFGTPEDAVTAGKQRQIARLAELWLSARPWALEGVRDVRFDIIAVDLTQRPVRVRHLPAAFAW
jgi:putative endonuclease